MAMMNYKNEYGSFPPCYQRWLVDARSHVLRLFPRTTNINNEVGGEPTPQTSLYYWLEGYYEKSNLSGRGWSKKEFEVQFEFG